MLNRRGLSLVELLIAIIVLGIVGLATSRIMRVMMNATTAQVAVAQNQGNVRTGMLAIPQEFREVGFDTVPYPVATPALTDLEAIAAHRITFRAQRGMGITCGTPTTTEFRVLKPVLGLRDPLITDGFLLFIENNRDRGDDDQWVPMLVANIDYNSTCGAQPAIRFDLSAVPIVNPEDGSAMSINLQRVGGPIRWFERIEYGPYEDPATGLAWIGVRSLSLGQASLQPIIGPLPDTTAFVLTYRNATGTVLDPTVANPLQVRSIGIGITGTTGRPVSMAGSTTRGRAVRTFTTEAALRNAIRP